MKSKDDKHPKAPSQLGKVDKDKVEEFTRLKADPEAELTPDECSWVLKCALCSVSVLLHDIII